MNSENENITIKKVKMFNVIGRCKVDNNRTKTEMPQIIFDELRDERKYWPYISENNWTLEVIERKHIYEKQNKS